MSIAMRKDRVESSAAVTDSSVGARELRFARRELKPGAWRRFQALPKRSYGPLLVYAVLGIAFVAALTIRIAAWLPTYWR